MNFFVLRVRAVFVFDFITEKLYYYDIFSAGSIVSIDFCFLCLIAASVAPRFFPFVSFVYLV